MSISVILSFLTVAASRARDSPSRTTRKPGAPLTRTGRAKRPSDEKRWAGAITSRAPRIRTEGPNGPVPASARRTTSGSRMASSPSKSPSRDAARKASTTVPCPAGQWLGRGRRPVEYRADLLEGHGEDVVQDEREPLGRRQRVEHDQQGHP